MPECGPPPGRLSPEQDTLLAAGFRLLLDPGESVAVADLADLTGWRPSAVETELAALSGLGRVQRTEIGRVTGCLGLTLETTNHTISVNGKVRHTWCALDAFGIMAALRATGWIDSTNGETGRSFHVDITDGTPRIPESSWVVFILERRAVNSLIAEWCPLVNMFESAEAAEDWAAARGVGGGCLNLAETAELGAHLWAPRINAGLGR